MLAPPIPCSSNTRAAASNSFSQVSSRVGLVRTLDMRRFYVRMQLDTRVYRVAWVAEARAATSAKPYPANVVAFEGVRTIPCGHHLEETMNELPKVASAGPLFNPLSPEFIRDPYPLYARLRATDPMYPAPFGGYMASRHAEVSLVL